MIMTLIRLSEWGKTILWNEFNDAEWTKME